MTTKIAILLFIWLCFDAGLSGTSTENTNHTFAKPIADLIKSYAWQWAWFAQNSYDRYPHEQYENKQKCSEYQRELQDLVVLIDMNQHDLDALLRFIRNIVFRTGLSRGKKFQPHLDTEARDAFKHSTFGPSDDMIENIEKLAEHSAWRVLNERAWYWWTFDHDEDAIEHNYQGLLSKFRDIERITNAPLYAAERLQTSDARLTEETDNERNREKEQTESRSRAKEAIERLGGDWKNSDHEESQETFHINTRTMEVIFSTITMNIEVLSDGLHLHHRGTNNVWALELDSDEDHMFCRHLTDETKHCHWKRMIPSSSLGPEQMKEIDEAVKRHLRRGQTQESKFESVKVFVQELNAIMQKRPKTSQEKIAERIQQVYPESWQREQSRLKRLGIFRESWFVTTNERKKKILEILRADLAKGPNKEYLFASDLLHVMEFTEWLMC